MTQYMSARFAATVTRPALTQIALMLVLSGLSLLGLGPVVAWSVLLGGMISTIPSTYFAYKVMSQTGARAMERVVRNAYLGEVIKLALIGTGFALVFVLVEPLHVPGLFAGFVLVHLVGLAVVIRYTRLGN
jgi:ATP synthase protein I